MKTNSFSKRSQQSESTINVSCEREETLIQYDKYVKSGQ